MTSTLTASIQALRNHFQHLRHLCISDVSDGHTATEEAMTTTRSLNASGKEYLLMVVAPEFQGMKTLARHRLVQSFFQQDFDTGKIHSMQLRTWTVVQWEKKGSPTSVRDDAPCCIDNNNNNNNDNNNDNNNADPPQHPIGTTARIHFRWWDENSEDDLRLAKALWGNPRVTALIGGPFNPLQVLNRLAKECKNKTVEGFQYWPMFRASTEEDPEEPFIGVCGLQRYTGETAQSHNLTNVVEMGFHLMPMFWRQGYATEAATAVLNFAFETVQVQAVYAGHHPSNVASGGALLKLGFEPVGKEFYPITGLEHPSYLLTRPASRIQKDGRCIARGESKHDNHAADLTGKQRMDSAKSEDNAAVVLATLKSADINAVLNDDDQAGKDAKAATQAFAASLAELDALLAQDSDSD
jgi:ribosomal-protein-alanine N-acetyltransferase